MVREERTGEGGGGGEGRGERERVYIEGGRQTLHFSPFHFATNFTSLFFQLSTLNEG